MTDWVQDQKADPTINQVVTRIEDKKLDTVKGTTVPIRRSPVLMWKLS